MVGLFFPGHVVVGVALLFTPPQTAYHHSYLFQFIRGWVSGWVGYQRRRCKQLVVVGLMFLSRPNSKMLLGIGEEERGCLIPTRLQTVGGEVAKQIRPEKKRGKAGKVISKSGAYARLRLVVVSKQIFAMYLYMYNTKYIPPTKLQHANTEKASQQSRTSWMARKLAVRKQ